MFRKSSRRGRVILATLKGALRWIPSKINPLDPPIFQPLESREMLSVIVPERDGPEVLLGENRAVYTGPKIVSAPDGSSVAVWYSNGLVAQRFDPSGDAQGAPFAVNSKYGGADPLDLSFAADGSFVVAWTLRQSSTNSNYQEIIARRFDSSGTPLGLDFVVNTYTSYDQYEPSVAVAPNGAFLVTWTTTNGVSEDVAGRLYDSHGVALGDEFIVHDTTQGTQHYSHAVALSDGSYVINWSESSLDASNQSVAGFYVRPISPAGVMQTPELLANQNSFIPVAFNSNADGSFDMAWPDNSTNSIAIKHFDNLGGSTTSKIQLSGVNYILAMAFDQEANLSVAYGGWPTDNTPTLDGSGSGIQAQRFSKLGVPDGPKFRVNTTTIGEQTNPSVAMGNDMSFTVIWAGPSASNSPSLFMQRYTGGVTEAPDYVGSSSPLLITDNSAPLLDLWTLFQDPQTSDSKLTFAFSMVPQTSITGQPLLSGLPSFDGRYLSIGSIPASGQSGETLLHLSATDQEGNATDFVLEAQVRSTAGPVVLNGLPIPVNTQTTDKQLGSAVDVALDGSYVVAWQSTSQDGSGTGIYAQRFSPAGTRLGGEFRVNTYTTGDQLDPQVAISPDGSFLIVWKGSGTGDSEGIFAQRYSSQGAAVGSEVRVNTYTTDLQTFPRAAAGAAGEFLVSWYGSGPGDNFGIFASRISFSGGTVGSEFLVNSSPTSNQREQSITMSLDNSFVIAWDSAFSGSTEVFARRFDSSGVPLGAQFQVNSTTTGTQNRTMIASAPDGSFVVAWIGPGNVANTTDVFARQFDSSGAPLGLDIRVLTRSSSRGNLVIGSDGSFLVTFATQAQFFSPTLTPSVPQLTLWPASWAAGPDGTYIATYTTTNLDGTDSEILAQKFTLVAPSIASISTFPAARPIPVTSIGVRFSEEVNLSTFNWQDINLTRNAGANLATSGITIAQASYDPKIYIISIPTSLVNQVGNYSLTVAGALIQSLTGTPFSGSKTTTWTIIANTPGAPALDPSSEGKPGSTFTQYANPIMKGTASPGSTVEIFEGASLKGTGVTAADGKYAITLSTLSSGVHTLKTRATDSFGTMTAFSADSTITVETANPTIVSMSVYTAPRTVPVGSTGIRFSSQLDIPTFTAADITLTRNGAPVSTAGITITVSPTDNKLFTIVIPPALNTPDGVYVLAVAGAGIKNLAGKTIVNNYSNTWTVLPQIMNMSQYSAPRSAPVTAVGIRLSNPIVLSTFTWADITLKRNNGANLATSAITITQSLTDPALYTILLPSALTNTPGSYVLTVTGAGIQSPSGFALSNNMSTTWTQL